MYSNIELDSDTINALPTPTGYKILVAIAEVAEKKGSIYMPDSLKSLENTASIVGKVLKKGRDAYVNPDKFSHDYCEEGDWVMVKAYSGVRFKYKGREYRLINDDQVEAVLPSIEGLERV